MAVLCVIRVSDTLRLLHVVVVGYHNILTERLPRLGSTPTYHLLACRYISSGLCYLGYLSYLNAQYMQKLARQPHSFSLASSISFINNFTYIAN